MPKVRTFFQRVRLTIGLQLYTLGDEVGLDLDATFAKVAAIGYREVQLPSLYGRPPAEIAAAARRAGLTIGSVHLPLLARSAVPGLTLASEPARIAEALSTLGARWVAVPIMLIPSGFRPLPGEDFAAAIGRTVAASGGDIWKQTAAALNQRAAALKPLGIRLAYHNQNVEFSPVDRTTGWDILWRETDPGLVSFEVDVGWIAAAGLDPVKFLERSRGRVSLLHVKDGAAGTQPNFKLKIIQAEVGVGTLP